MLREETSISSTRHIKSQTHYHTYRRAHKKSTWRTRMHRSKLVFLWRRGTGCLPMEIKYEMEMKTNQHKKWSVEDGKEGMVKVGEGKRFEQTQMASHVYLVDFILVLVLGTMLLLNVPPNHLVFSSASFTRWARWFTHIDIDINKSSVVVSFHNLCCFYFFEKREMSRC